jgi:hypothetical protein
VDGGVGGSRSRHLVVWFRVAKKLRCTGQIKNPKGKGLVVVREDIRPVAYPTRVSCIVWCKYDLKVLMSS